MKSTCVLKSNVFPIKFPVPSEAEPEAPKGLPAEVRRAMAHDWGVFVDAYLLNGARVRDRFAATVYFCQSGKIQDGTTVATLPVRHLGTQGAFKLLQTLDGSDHYVLVSEQGVGRHDGDSD